MDLGIEDNAEKHDKVDAEDNVNMGNMGDMDSSQSLDEDNHAVASVEPGVEGGAQLAGRVRTDATLLGRRMYTEARKDFKTLASGQVIDKRRRVVNRLSTETLLHALQFLFHVENAQILAWGTKTEKVGGNLITLPAVTRKKSKASLYRQHALQAPPPGARLIGRTLFFDIVDKVTARERVNRQAVDYVVRILVNEMLDSLLKVVSLSSAGEQRKSLLFELERVGVFLKHGFGEMHVSGNDKDEDGFHSPEFAFGKSSGGTRDVKCVQCRMPFDFLENLLKFVPPDRPDAMEVIEEAKHRFILYYGHVHRVKAHQGALRMHMDRISTNRMYHRVLIVIDWKMKFEALFFRETMQRWHGKKGISWHGAAVYYLPHEFSTESAMAGEFAMMFLDHILGNESTQDWCSVAAVVECVAMRVKQELPHVSEVCFVSDNAGCYNINILPVVLPYICKSSDLQLVSYLHGETCDGKGACDAHFSVGMSRVCAFCRQGNDVATPHAIAVALTSDGGIANTIAEVVTTDRNSAGLLRWLRMEEKSKKNLRKIGRANEVRYEPVPGTDKFSLQVWKVSNYGTPRQILASREGVTVIKPSGVEPRVEPGAVAGAAEEDSEDEAALEQEHGDDSGEEEGGDRLANGDALELVHSAAVATGASAATSGDVITGQETGATVSASGSLRRCMLRLLRLRTKRLKAPDRPASSTVEDDSDNMGDKVIDCLFSCPQCSALYLTKRGFEAHLQTCDGATEKLSSLERGEAELPGARACPCVHPSGAVGPKCALSRVSTHKF